MNFDMVYPKHELIWWNINISVNPEESSWYVNFLGAYILHTIFI